MSSAVSVTLQHTQTKLYQGISRDRSGLLASVHLSRNVEFIASVARANDERGARREAYAGVTVLFGRSSASVAHVRDSRGNRLAVEAQQPLPVGTGYGYQLRAEGGPNASVNGVARYQGTHGRYELRQETIGSRVDHDGQRHGRDCRNRWGTLRDAAGGRKLRARARSWR